MGRVPEAAREGDPCLLFQKRGATKVQVESKQKRGGGRCGWGSGGDDG